jgi:hypothetical protein
MFGTAGCPPLPRTQDEFERARADAEGEQACLAVQLRIDRLAHDLRRSQEAVEATCAARTA